MVNPLDLCPKGRRDWTRSTSNDYDGDGCLDIDIKDEHNVRTHAAEDDDFDNDGIKNLGADGVSDLGMDGLPGTIDDDPTPDDDKCLKGRTGWISSPTSDNDGDGCLDDDITDESGRVTHSAEDVNDDNDAVLDATDVDKDNDGLIEIYNLDMLANIRYNLEGTSYDEDEIRYGS